MARASVVFPLLRGPNRKMKALSGFAQIALPSTLQRYSDASRSRWEVSLSTASCRADGS